MFDSAELILNKDGSIYHLHCLPEHIADTVITVGDPERVAKVSQYFDVIEYKSHHREFIIHTGKLKHKPLTVLSTGMGPDNIEIVMNELDALANIDLVSREIKSQIKSLDIIRIGTTGCIVDDIPLNAFLMNQAAIGFDTMLHFYQYQQTENEKKLLTDLVHAIGLDSIGVQPYMATADYHLLELFAGSDIYQGITITCNGFYAPQGRRLRGKLALPNMVTALSSYDFGNTPITNLEMETAAIYGLGGMFGHRCCSLNAVVAQRKQMAFSEQIEKTIDRLIRYVLEKLCGEV